MDEAALRPDPRVVRFPPTTSVLTRISVVIPTYERREQVAAAVAALASCRSADAAEVVVVVDGSTDATVERLVELETDVRLTAVDQPNRGAAAARNAGAAVASGAVLLFLDDDMIADEALLEAHLRRQAERPSVVLGHIPVHPDSPRSVLKPSLGRWVDARRDRLQAGGEISIADWLSGQFSVPRTLFEQVGGFDESFNAHGSFGGEDTDLFSRLRDAGAPVIFAPEAISAQVYTVTPRRNLSQWRESGTSDARLVRKHPDMFQHTLQLHRGDGRLGRACRSLVASSLIRGAPLRTLNAATMATVDRFPDARLAQEAHSRVRQIEYWAGAAEAGGLSPEPRTAVLAYHAITSHPSDRLATYAVTPAALEAQVHELLGAGWTIARPVDYVAHLRGEGTLRDLSLLLTFDDAYADIATTVRPILEPLGAAGVTFCVAGLVGAVNSWDVRDAADELPLLDWSDLHDLHRAGWVVGGHSWSHRHLTTLDRRSLAHEVADSAAEMVRRGLPRPGLFAFPYGEHDARVRARARAAGYDLLFGIGGFGRDGVLPRIEVTAADDAFGLVARAAAALAAHASVDSLRPAVLRREAVGLVRTVLP